MNTLSFIGRMARCGISFRVALRIQNLPLRRPCGRLRKRPPFHPLVTWLTLDSKAAVARTAFPLATHWPPDLFVVPEHAFAVEVAGHTIELSHEHDEARWLPFDEAVKLLTWDSNRVALWELNQRLNKAAEPRAPANVASPAAELDVCSCSR
jgi:8-oxo-dGTP pyrophosphatase MutT (NUDIX family)